MVNRTTMKKSHETQAEYAMMVRLFPNIGDMAVCRVSIKQQADHLTIESSWNGKQLGEMAKVPDWRGWSLTRGLAPKTDGSG